jgi:hypothetical protein
VRRLVGAFLLILGESGDRSPHSKSDLKLDLQNDA